MVTHVSNIGLLGFSDFGLLCLFCSFLEDIFLGEGGRPPLPPPPVCLLMPTKATATHSPMGRTQNVHFILHLHIAGELHTAPHLIIIRFLRTSRMHRHRNIKRFHVIGISFSLSLYIYIAAYYQPCLQCGSKTRRR